MANKTIQVSRNQALYSSKVSAKNALKRLMNNAAPPQDGEIKCVRYTDEDGYERTLLGAYKMNGEGISYVSILEPEDVRTSDSRIMLTCSAEGAVIRLYGQANWWSIAHHADKYEKYTLKEGKNILTDSEYFSDSTANVICNENIRYGFYLEEKQEIDGKEVNTASYITSCDFTEWVSDEVECLMQFMRSTSISDIDLSYCDLSHNKYWDGFLMNTQITEFDLSTIDTSSGITFGSGHHSGFLQNTKIASLDLSKLNTSNGKEFIGFLSKNSNLELPDYTALDWSSIRMDGNPLSGMFMSNIYEQIDLSFLEGKAFTGTTGEFIYNMPNLTSVDLSPLSDATFTDMTICVHCPKLTSLNLSPINTSRLEGFHTPQGLTALKEFTFPDNFKGVKLKSILRLCSNNANMETIDMTNIDTSEATFWVEFLYLNPKLTKVIGDIDLSSCEDYSWMFSNDRSLTTIYITNFGMCNTKEMTVSIRHAPLSEESVRYLVEHAVNRAEKYGSDAKTFTIAMTDDNIFYNWVSSLKVLDAEGKETTQTLLDLLGTMGYTVTKKE